jgi:hypothetical protein
MIDRQAFLRSFASIQIVENIALFGGKRPLRATILRPINRAFAAQNRIYPVLIYSPAIYRGALTLRIDVCNDTDCITSVCK